MNHLIPIQITLQAANAEDARQLVQDLAGTMSVIKPGDVPADTTVSAVSTTAPVPFPAPATPVTVPVSGAVYQPPGPVQSSAQTQYVPQPVQQPPIQQPPVHQVPTTAPAYTMEQLAVAATALVDAGRQPELIQLLQSFGAQSLTQVPKERYGEFATALRSMGARI